MRASNAPTVGDRFGSNRKFKRHNQKKKRTIKKANKFSRTLDSLIHRAETSLLVPIIFFSRLVSFRWIRAYVRSRSQYKCRGRKKACVRSVLSNCEFVVAAAAAVIDVLFACVHFQWAFSLLSLYDSMWTNLVGRAKSVGCWARSTISRMKWNAVANIDRCTNCMTHTRTHSAMHRCLLQNGLP